MEVSEMDKRVYYIDCPKCKCMIKVQSIYTKAEKSRQPKTMWDDMGHPKSEMVKRMARQMGVKCIDVSKIKEAK
jgi:hypothetical protein